MKKIRRKDFGYHLLKHPNDKIEGGKGGWRGCNSQLGGRWWRQHRPVVPATPSSGREEGGVGPERERDERGRRSRGTMKEDEK